MAAGDRREAERRDLHEHLLAARLRVDAPQVATRVE
jgi:hypothetical protein